MSTYEEKCQVDTSLDPSRKMVCDMILFIGGLVDWQAWETWMGDIGYRGRGCVSLESEGKEMSRLMTDTHVNLELEFCEMLKEFAINFSKKCRKVISVHL